MGYIGPASPPAVGQRPPLPGPQAPRRCGLCRAIVVSYARAARSRIAAFSALARGVESGRGMFRFRLASSLAVGLLPLFAFGCSSETYEEISYETPASSASTVIDDTAPPEATYDPSLTYTDRHGREVNHSTDRFRFDVAAFRTDEERDAANVLYPSHAAYLSAHPGALPSVQTVGTYVKQLDDTIYAGVERAVQDGLGTTIEPKRAILTGALESLLAHRSTADDDAAVYVAAALRLGGASATVPADLEPRVAAAMSDFRADEAVSKPIGFYTWSDELRAIWMQDRFLQGSLASGEASCALARAIAAEPARADRYRAIVALYSKLTNPVHASLVDVLTTCAPDERRPFLSTSRTSEVALFQQLYPNGLPANANLMQDLIDAIRGGRIDLAPKADSGWYQWQSYALETLLVTDKSEERAKIGFTAPYKKRLQEAFSTMLVQHRETHVKQADMYLDTAAAGPTTPDFRVEPLATVYVRHARSYVFLERALDAAMGEELLDTAVAVGADGASDETLRARIHRARDLFYGLYLASCFDLGLKPKLDVEGDPAADAQAELTRAADEWLRGLGQDPVAGADVRVLVPIASVDATRTRYWAVIGVRTTLAGYSFITDGSMTAPAKPEDQTRAELPTEQFLEVTSSSVPPTRDEYRALCDANPTADAIKTALEKR